jgi:hypothetical protein
MPNADAAAIVPQWWARTRKPNPEDATSIASRSGVQWIGCRNRADTSTPRTTATV